MIQAMYAATTDRQGNLVISRCGVECDRVEGVEGLV
jgi:hypothetical protein